MRPDRSQSLYEKGFTLLELLVVLTLLGLLWSAAVFNGFFEEENDDRLAARIIGFLSDAQYQAAAQGTVISVEVGNKLALKRDGKVIREWRAPGHAQLSVEFPRLKKEQTQQIFFYPDGSATPAIIYLDSKQKASFIRIDAWSGMATHEKTHL